MRLEEFEKQINDVINSKEKELDELISKIKQTKEDINKAKQKLWELENTLEFYQERIKFIEAPTPDKYFSYVDTLDEILEDEINKVLEKAKPVIKQIDELLEKENDIVVRAGNLGSLMQKALMGDLILSNGRSVTYRLSQDVETLLAFEKVYKKYKYPDSR